MLGVWIGVPKGYFNPRNPDKYKGDPSGIVWRSTYELKLFRWLDRHPDIEWWASEEKFIPYMMPTEKSKGKIRRYYPDVIMKAKGRPVTMIEVKPHYQTVEPKRGKKQSERSFLREVVEWGKNDAKWKAARHFCKDRGWDFQIMTEYELGIKKRK